MTEKQDSLYIKACVIANGVRDKQNDVITKRDIKKIFTNSIDVGFDVDHDNIRQKDIYFIENYISKSEEKLGDCIVPAGSWMTVLRVDNNDVQDMIRKHEINGVSITAYPEHDAEIKRSNPRVLLYKDIKEKDQLHPKEVSLVKSPANNLPLEIMDYDTYLSKSVDNGEDNVTNKIEKEDNSESMSTINKLVDILASFTHKSDDPVKEESVSKSEGNVSESEKVEKEEEKDDQKRVEETTGEQETEVTTDEKEDSVEKSMIPPQQAQPQANPAMQQQQQGGPEQALIQIAQICAKFLQQTQQAQAQPMMQSTDAEEPVQVSKSDEELEESKGSDEGETEEKIEKSNKVSKRETQKYDETQVSRQSDMATLFAKQQHRDPWTFEKLD